MTQKVYGLVADNGDGSCSMCWFQKMESVDWLLDTDNGRESFWANDGGPAETLTFPDELNLAECGFRFSDDIVGEEE